LCFVQFQVIVLYVHRLTGSSVSLCVFVRRFNGCCYQGPAASLTDVIDWDLTRAPLCAKSNRMDWDLCIKGAPRQATAAVIRDQQQADKSMIGTLTSPAVAKSLTGYWIGTQVTKRAGNAAAVMGTSSKLDKLLIGTLPKPRCCEILGYWIGTQV
jgi:hypothetical protein